jgi:hypothetical protein
MVDNPHLDDPSLRHLPGLGQRNRASRAPDRDFELGVLRLLETHGEAEGALLDAYSKVAERSSGKGATEFLVQLILDDEYRHHQMFAEMANALRSFLWEVPVRPSLPSMPVHSDPDLLAETKRLLAFEKHDAKELRKLRKTLKHSPSSSLDPLMVELMLHDTAKHIAILEFIEAHLTN